ncbi:hypothetical protein B9G98_02689 [Wickerhamiella sorbophila]|uniref:Uncharacterized protein n=1 Tax=Wickerhamiella sorbophila TaxID=45607 RepID=A0A2T0FJF6_9ASCO|nr:hypothetical protein B9G98_02689 [Wickerhamiella sorbophila]PRT55069.1 hypothetical protein B9G98_02689 [Wickerhamiella sorbophila]
MSENIKHRSTVIKDVAPESINMPEKDLYKRDPPKPRRPTVDVIVEILQKRDGKDKSIKIIQYTAKLIMILGKTPAVSSAYAKYGLDARLSPLARELSMFRKVIKLFDWVKTLREIQEDDELDWISLVDLYTEIMDDLYFYAKIGVLDKRLTDRFARQADIGWFITIFGNLYRKSQVSVKGKAWRLDVAKLLCDLVFCTIDVFEIPADGSWQIVSGLASASVGYYKIWRKVCI